MYERPGAILLTACFAIAVGAAYAWLLVRVRTI
jgi:hypothetical protein